MAKRSSFDRVPRDYYPTPFDAVLPLIPHLNNNTRFAEPCAGDGRLIRHLEKFGHDCVLASDIEPQSSEIDTISALDLTDQLKKVDCVITNTPWDRKILHPMIEHFRNYCPAWLLLDADWAFTKQASDYMKYCSAFVAVGRVKWIEDSKMTGKDNAAWYLFMQDRCKTVFHAR